MRKICQDQIIDSYNNRLFAFSPQAVQIILKIQYVVHIKVFRMVTNSGVDMPLYTFRYDIRLNPKAFNQVTENG